MENYYNLGVCAVSIHGFVRLYTYTAVCVCESVCVWVHIHSCVYVLGMQRYAVLCRIVWYGSVRKCEP